MHVFKPVQQEKINQKFKIYILVDPKQTVCKIQVSFHLSLKFTGQKNHQRRDIILSAASVFGQGHDMGPFCPFSTRIYTNSTSFLGSEKLAKRSKTHVESTET